MANLQSAPKCYIKKSCHIFFNTKSVVLLTCVIIITNLIFHNYYKFSSVTDIWVFNAGSTLTTYI